LTTTCVGNSIIQYCELKYRGVVAGPVVNVVMIRSGRLGDGVMVGVGVRVSVGVGVPVGDGVKLGVGV